MPRPVAGRRTDSLFDNRYRYDHIYPRGRSGETLHAYDTLDADRQVVIKRPAPQDAPPMRAGQEVSILNEKRALERLAGHPVLTELRHSGSFRVGGQTHQYIAIDLAEGITVEDSVIELAARGEHLPDLETLVILDKLLDLLETAHARKIIYNDVDAKHLFWDRAHYRLKVIDWGNAVFLDGESTHITRANDIYQSAELLYFILSGGHRLEIDRRNNEPLLDLPENTVPRLKTILSRATSADPNGRYQEVAALRRDLAEVRRPLERSRDQIVDRAKGRLTSAASQDQLEQLIETLQEAITADPGYPPALELRSEIEMRLKQLSIQGDLDAARIYIESGNPARAASLLNEVVARIGIIDQPLLVFLLDVADQLESAHLSRPPAGLAPALDALYRGDPQSAGRALVTTPESRPDAYAQQLLLAERLTQRMPNVSLLRPHLARIDHALSARIADRAALMRLTAPLDNPAEHGVQALRGVYLTLAESLPAFAERLDEESRAAADRAQRTALEIADLLETVGQNVIAEPGLAGNALWHAAAIDPANAAFEGLNNTLNAFHAELEAISASTLKNDDPQSDPLSDPLRWLTDTRNRLSGYAADLPDSAFQSILRGLDDAIVQWGDAISAFAAGGRRPAVDAYTRAADDVRLLNESVARWFSDRARQIESAKYIETLSPNAQLGRALADGWDAWDHGRTSDAQASAARAREAAQSAGERAAADRLDRLSAIMAGWLADDGIAQRAVTERALADSNALLLPAEEAIWRKFSSQMPNMTIYLKAMVRGLVEPLRDASSAAVRILFMDYSLRGVLALQSENNDDLNTWKEAASRALPNPRIQPLYQTLETAITRRHLLTTAVQALNNVRGVTDLQAARQAVRAPLASAQLESADQAFRALDDALRRWADGDFRSARQLLESAQERIITAEKAIATYVGSEKLSLQPFKMWLSGVNTAAETLQAARRSIEQAALIPAALPDPAVEQAHDQIVTLTLQTLGEEYSALLRQWRDTYVTIRQTYEDQALTKAEKARLIEGHFSSLFIDRHPAYPIYRHWQGAIALLPDTPPSYASEYAAGQYADSAAPAFVADAHAPSASNLNLEAPVIGSPDIEPIMRPETIGTPPPEARFPWLIGVAVIGVVIVVAAIGLLALQNRSPGTLVLTIEPSAAQNQLSNGGTAQTAIGAVAVKATDTPTITLGKSATPTLSSTPAPPTDTPANTPLPPTVTTTVLPTLPPVVPTETRPPTVTSIATSTVQNTVASTLAPTLAAGVETVLPAASIASSPQTPVNVPNGDYNLLDGLATLPPDGVSWSADLFSNATGSGWQLGTSNTKAGNAIQVVHIDAKPLTVLYGAQASRHITRVDATLELIGYDKTLVPNGLVYFGLGFDTPQGQRAAAQIKLTTISPQVISEGVNFNGKFAPKTQFGTASVKITLSARRNADNTVSVYADGQLLGTTTNTTYGPATPVSIVLYTSAQSVLVTVRTLTIHIG